MTSKNTYATGAHGIELCEEGLRVFLLREEVILTYDKIGECIDAQKVVAKSKNHYTQIRNFLGKTNETIGGRHYSMQRDVNIGESYSRFVVIDTDGVETVLYQDSTGHGGEIIIIAAGVLFLIFVAVMTLKKYEHDSDIE